MRTTTPPAVSPVLRSPASTRRRLGAGVAAGLAIATLGVAVVPAAASAAGGRSSAAAVATPDSRMFAVVDGASGGLNQSDAHVLTSVKLGNGLDGRLYRISFDRDIRDCAYLATPTGVRPGDLVNADTGIAVRQNRSFATRQVLDVITKDGGPGVIINDSSFSLLVECR